ncbi:PAS domain S-box protein [Phreatobacter stygius]|uniref:Blue-light-activated histidine kinase n=1 Tax=Phreatobacter stygius TaxID=1940610 RepID=A0A4D7B541_9HYPH|nr:PAS domain S-box protein [Phreatobacter stygius]QCI68524.1 PAS domain S-box protein [Phreatobacter stygius]
MIAGTDLLEALPVAVYTTDAEGRITFYNEAAAQFWGHRPTLGSDRWCGSWRLFWPDGRPLPHDECPMAVTLREGRPVRGVEAVAERPDGTRVPFMPYPTPLKDASGQVTGAINLLVDIGHHKTAEIESARLAAIVASSDDAIISKTLEGRITSWNAGATRIFGYEADEMIGAPILRIIPPELHEEEFEILAKLKRGERLDHFETIRVARDGRRLDISLTVSPLFDKAGHVIGTSKVARDITERKRSEELQRLLFDELNHRVKNTLATIQAIASQSLRRATSPGDFVQSFNGRVQALARAHDLLVRGKMTGADVAELVREQVVLGSPDGTRIVCSGPRLKLDAQAAVQLALVLHELATNARKYGALSVPTGQLSINWKMQMNGGRELFLEWQESGVPKVDAPTSHGFGTTLIQRTLETNGGQADMHYGAHGVVCEIRLHLPEQAALEFGERAALALVDDRPGVAEPAGLADLRGKRILLIEDEPLVAMDIEHELIAAGCQVIGPAGTITSASRLIADTPCDAALVDANLAGHPVDELAAALAAKGIPFAFATGYGRDGLPGAFQEKPILAKPFSSAQLLAMMTGLLGKGGQPPS